MGQALLASVGANVSGLRASALEAAIRQALDRLLPVAALRPSPASAVPQDVLERAPRPIGAGGDRGAASPVVTAGAAESMEQLSAATEAAFPTADALSLGPAGASESRLSASVEAAVRPARASAARDVDLASTRRP
jgi:hypothetical protein